MTILIALAVIFLFRLSYPLPGRIYRFAGVPGSSGYNSDNIQATAATLNIPTGVRVDNRNNVVYISDYNNNRVRVVDCNTTIIKTLAGTTSGFVDNVSPSASKLSQPMDTVIDPLTQQIYISDSANNRIRVINKTSNTIKTIAGSGSTSYTQNVLGTTSGINLPGGIAMDSRNNRLYISEYNTYRILYVSLEDGYIHTLAGSANGFDGDGGLAVNAKLINPMCITVDESRNMAYFCDTGNNRVRSVNLSTGIIQTIVGTGSTAYNGNNIPASSVNLNSCKGLAINVPENVFTIDRFE
ncbi:NHL repeat-containing protein [Acrasis kona]|uniref:NHL repeat-containing protein n=1 Tax=Acrasis kona TaxID=1008807 RepID=A0AAW2ZMZ1_9EUKA